MYCIPVLQIQKAGSYLYDCKAQKPGLVRIAFAKHDTSLYQEPPLPHHVYYSPTEERIFFFLFFYFLKQIGSCDQKMLNRNWILSNKAKFSL